ncbi:MAG: hypothetical protein ACP5KP_04850, partial [Candidatus Micrarchaeia archaeon]
LLPDNKNVIKNIYYRRSTMLQPTYTYEANDCNNNLFVSRYEEIVQQYEDPIRAMVHRTLEVYIEKAFEEFIGGNIGKYVHRAGDGKIVKECRKIYWAHYGEMLPLK